MDCLSSGVQGQSMEQGKTPSLLKIQKIGCVWRHVSVIPATREAETGESLEPRRLQRAEMAPLHSRLGAKVRFHQKKKERKKEK